MTKMVGCVGRLLRWTNLLKNAMLQRLDGAVSTSPSIVVFTWLVLHGHRGAFFFLNERARDCAYFIDREEEYKPEDR